MIWGERESVIWGWCSVEKNIVFAEELTKLYHEVLARRRMRRVLRSWSRIFFSISASVSVSRNGHHWSASEGFRKGRSTVGRGFSLNFKKSLVIFLKTFLICLPKSIGTLIPRQLSSNTVRNCGDKFATKTEFGAKFKSKLFWVILLFRHVPLKLVNKRNIANMNIQLKTNRVNTNNFSTTNQSVPWVQLVGQLDHRP